ncbi:hypothetical protein H0H87_004811, partial [Tephrocybe sp. NHM501043]
MVDLDNGRVAGLDIAPEPTKASPPLPVNDHNLIGLSTPAPSIQEITTGKFSSADLGVGLGSIHNDELVLATAEGATAIAST